MDRTRIIKAVQDYVTVGKIGRGISVEDIGAQIVITYKTKSAGSWSAWYNRKSRYLEFEVRDASGATCLEGRISHLELKR